MKEERRNGWKKGEMGGKERVLNYLSVSKNGQKQEPGNPKKRNKILNILVFQFSYIPSIA